MTDDDIAKARAAIIAARNPPSVIGCRYCESTGCDTDCSFAERHLGVVRRTAAAVRAEALDEPLTGWSAALDEVERLRALAAPGWRANGSDGIATPKGKRRILLDLAPSTVERLLECARGWTGHDGHDILQRLLVEALEKAR